MTSTISTLPPELLIRLMGAENLAWHLWELLAADRSDDPDGEQVLADELNALLTEDGRACLAKLRGVRDGNF